MGGIVTNEEEKRRESPRDENKNINMIFAPSTYIKSKSKHMASTILPITILLPSTPRTFH